MYVNVSNVNCIYVKQANPLAYLLCLHSHNFKKIIQLIFFLCLFSHLTFKNTQLHLLALNYNSI